MARLDRGFTLIELMIVLTVAAILAAVAVPAYIDQMRAGRRAEAREMLMQIQAAQERWRTNNASYAAALADLGIDPPTTPSGNYALSISGASSTGYVVTATAQAKQSGDVACGTLKVTVGGPSLNNSPANTKYEPAAPSKCW